MKLLWTFLVHVFLWPYALTSLDIYLGMEFLVHRKIAYLASIDTAEQFSRGFIPLPTPTPDVCVVGLLSCQHLVVSVLLI